MGTFAVRVEEGDNNGGEDNEEKNDMSLNAHLNIAIILILIYLSNPIRCL